MKYGHKKFIREANAEKHSARALGYSIRVKTVKGLAAKRAEVQKLRELKEEEWI